MMIFDHFSQIPSNAWIFAQARGWLEVLGDMETAKLIMILLFGTGLVAAASTGIAKIIRALNASPELEELEERLQRLEQRIATSEKEQGESVQV